MGDTRRRRLIDDCNSALRSADCSDALPPSQLTRDELAQVARCAEHRSAVCARARGVPPSDLFTASRRPSACSASS